MPSAAPGDYGAYRTPRQVKVSEFDASKNELAIETLEIAHEGLTFEQTPPPDPAPAK